MLQRGHVCRMEFPRWSMGIRQEATSKKCKLTNIKDAGKSGRGPVYVQNGNDAAELSMAYYHLCRPHASLTKRFKRPTTPFMAAGLTDHVWTMLELLLSNRKINADKLDHYQKS